MDIQQKTKRFLLACLTGSLLLAAAACSRTQGNAPTMVVPSTEENISYVESEQIHPEQWATANPETKENLALRDVELASGGIVHLYAFDNETEPLVGTDELTSLSGKLILNSAAVQLGETGTTRELAENELFRWTASSGFDSVAYTQPLEIAAGKYVVSLTLKNEELTTEQVAVFTDIGEGLARIDRVWRTVDGSETEEDNALFAAIKNDLANG